MLILEKEGGWLISDHAFGKDRVFTSEIEMVRHVLEELTKGKASVESRQGHMMIDIWR